MATTSQGAGERKPNPKCTCAHPISFHPRDKVKHRRPCRAFGCKCSNFKAQQVA